MANDFKSRTTELKPRERIETAGSASVASAVELLAIILKTGAAGCDVMELSRRLIDAFGGVEELVKTDLNTLKNGVREYNRRNPERKILGLGRVKMLELAAAFELARRVRRHSSWRDAATLDAETLKSQSFPPRKRWRRFVLL